LKLLFFRFRTHLKYLIFWRHRKGHGIHSPFVFDIVNRIFRNKITPTIVSTVENLRKKMISDRRMIDFTDLGSGAASGKEGQRQLSKIARHSPVSRKYGILLSRLASEFGRPYVVEFGTSIGISTMYMAAAREDIRVFTIEGCPSVSKIALENFRAAGFSNIDLMTGSFDDLLPTVMALPGCPGFVFIDGNHRKDPVIKYFGMIKSKSDEKTVIAIDDIHYSPEMEAAWDIIRNDVDVPVTIDTGRMGIIFFRKGVTRGHYKVRY
jgi:predicted O-methyltransferase YrrM